MGQDGTLVRAFDLIEAVLKSGRPTIPSLPRATAHRLTSRLVELGYLHCVARGRYVAGPRLVAIRANLNPSRIAAEIVRPILARAAGNGQRAIHLGVMENDLVRYLVKEGGAEIFSREDMQLEAYASAIGKILLAQLGSAERRAYFDAGPLVPLTEHTIVDPALLMEELDRIAADGYAIDDNAIMPGLVCVAVPIPAGFMGYSLALSMSWTGVLASPPTAMLDRLRGMAQEVAERLTAYGSSPVGSGP
jgi:DNA-binding IclR family transcriptional regulator